MWAEGQMASNVATKEVTAGILRPDSLTGWQVRVVKNWGTSENH